MPLARQIVYNFLVKCQVTCFEQQHTQIQMFPALKSLFANDIALLVTFTLYPSV